MASRSPSRPAHSWTTAAATTRTSCRPGHGRARPACSYVDSDRDVAPAGGVDEPESDRPR
jgi:hypothetical protein